ncbi:MAG: penicillin-binding protein activator, partial [Colwellia sp.]|nr:penicillin-binding protein activator [Colwellia sp.]
ANQVTDLVNDKASIYRLLLVKAASLQALNYTEQAYQHLTLIKTLVTQTHSSQSLPKDDEPALHFTLPYYQTLSDVLFAKSQQAAATSALLFAFSLNDYATEEDIHLLWQQLSALHPWQLQQIAKSKPPFFAGWQQLLHYSHKFGGNASQLSRYLSLWQQQHPTHPARLIAHDLANKELVVDNIENVAVLLPLSGAQASAGLAAQQGILAAYQNNTRVNIHFINTNKVDWDNLATDFNTLSIDHVIGPLLKNNVDKYLALSVENASLQVPALLLNLPQHHTLASYQTALSMRPENEAHQAATVLSQRDYQAPIVLSHQDKVSKRIAQAFSKQWQTKTGKSVDIVYFNQGKQMQASLKESLDVNASQARINELSSRLKQTIKAEARNRRDIDMIYLVGSAAQTRLIKPYIDVNTSPFAKVIPVYASSRSHSRFNDLNNESSIADLQDLTFTQMPWLLNSKQQNKPLAQLSQNLWPKRTDSLSRIFAMGFDSFNLLPKISSMQQAPYILHFGQTGTLKLDENNILTRSLTWGRYQNDKVTEIVME